MEDACNGYIQETEVSMPCSHPSWLRATFFAPWVLLCAAPAIAGSFTYATIPPVDQDGRDLAGTIAAGINDSGVVAATADAELGVTTAVLWSPGASHVTSYQYAINDSTNFTAINDSGLVTGYYQTNPGTQGTEKFLAFVYNSANGIQQNINISSKDFAVSGSNQCFGPSRREPISRLWTAVCFSVRQWNRYEIEAERFV
jgi:hypothetical protein